MKYIEHNPRCAIVRTGDIRAWCDCGAEIPVLNELRANAAEQIGASKERIRIKGLIQQRIDTHSDFVKSCMDRDIKPSDGHFAAMVALRSLLRELERSDDETDD